LNCFSIISFGSFPRCIEAHNGPAEIRCGTWSAAVHQLLALILWKWTRERTVPATRMEYLWHGFFVAVVAGGQQAVVAADGGLTGDDGVVLEEAAAGVSATASIHSAPAGAVC
jgi:hypothetical protein